MGSLHLPRLSYLGYGLLEAWSICMVFWRAPDAVGSLGTLSFHGLPYTMLTNLSAVAVILGSLAFVLAFRRGARAMNRRAMTAGAALLTAAGTACVLWGGGELVLAGLVLTGLGNAWLWISWGDVFASVGTDEVESVAIGSSIVQVVAVVAVMLAPETVRSVLLVLVAPLAGTLYLVSLHRLGVGPYGPDGPATPGAPQAEGLPDGAGSHGGAISPATVARSVLGLGVPILCVNYLLDNDIAFPAMEDGFNVALLAGVMLFVIVFYCFIMFVPNFSIESITKVISSLIVVAVVAAGLGVWVFVSNVAMVSILLLCQYLLLIYCTRLHARGAGPSVLVFAVGELVNHTAGFVGVCASQIVHAAAPSGFALLQPTVIAMLAVLFGLVVAMDSHLGRGTRGAGDAQAYANPSESTDPSEAFASDHGLSAREMEVLSYLVKGRSAPFIRDELCISLNTVSSHIKHIYSKLGVHSRQELLDLVEREMSAL